MAREVIEVIEVAKVAPEVPEATEEVIEEASVSLISQSPIKMVIPKDHTLQLLLNESLTNKFSCFY